MRRKNVILTLWLAAPIATFAGLYALIFITLDTDKPMADAAPVGAGAGDTGNANALGQWLAGRDPDAVSLATKAKREHLMIAPSDWPGGVLLRVPSDVLPDAGNSVYLSVILKEPGRFRTTGMKLDSQRGVYECKIQHEDLQDSARFVISTSFPSRDGVGFVDEENRALAVLSLSPVLAPREVEVSDPLPIDLPIDTVFHD